MHGEAPNENAGVGEGRKKRRQYAHLDSENVRLWSHSSALYAYFSNQNPNFTGQLMQAA